MSRNKFAHAIAKAIVLIIVLILTIPSVTALTVASVIVWFYGEDVLTPHIAKRIALFEKFLPVIFTE